MVGVTPEPSSPRTLAEKVWDAHVVRSADGEPDLLYIDLHLLHEVTSPQAFDGLRMAGRRVRRTDLTLASDIGTSEVEHVLATQTLPQARPRTMAVTVNGRLRPGVTAKDLVLALIAKVGTGGGRGHIVEYRGEAIRALSMEGRMTIANMSIEWGAKAGMIAPDETTFAYLRDKPHAPQGVDWEAAVEYWKSLATDEDATFDREVVLRAEDIAPFVTWGTNPGQGIPLSQTVPSPDDFDNENDKVAAERALTYMGL